MEFEANLKLDKILTSENLAEKLDDKQLDAIGSQVVEGYETDINSRSNWADKVDEWIELAMQISQPKTHPWPNAANVKYPLITTASLQFSARAYPALLPGTNLVRGKVVGFDLDGSKLERAVRLGKHMSYQLLDEMEDWEEEMDRLLFSLPIVGCMFKKTYFDSVKGRNVSEVVYPKELVVNYWAKSLEDAERITHVLHMSENDIYERTSGGIYIEQDLEKPAPKASDAAIDNVAGTEAPENNDGTTPFTMLEQCIYLDMDGDGYKEPYIATTDLTSRKVVRIVPRFAEEDVSFNDKSEVLRINPTSYYTKFSFIPSPDGGFYDIGFGILLGPINETINTVINQLLDSGTLSNMQSGFISKGIRIKGGNKSFTPGEWKYANTVGDDLRKGLVPLPVREPSQVLFSLLGMMIESGEKLSSVTEIMSGDIPGQNTKATVAMAAIEQGMKVFSSIYKRVHRSLGKEYKKLYKLNSIFLPDESYFSVLDVGQEGAQQIQRKDYDMENNDVAPASDPNVATEEQRMAKVQALMELLQMGTVNPQEVTKRYLEATEQPNIEALMQMPQPQPNPEIEMEKEKFADESARAWEELDIRRTTAEAGALKSIADAEAAEEGDQLAEYQQVMKGMQDDDLAGQKLDQLQQAHMQKMQQQEQQAQMKMQQQQQQGEQKMRQQEQLNQQKLAQGQQGAATSGTGNEGTVQ